MRRLMALGAAGVIAVALAACSSGGGSTTVKGKNGSVTVDKNGNGKVTFKGKEGTATFGAGSELPSDFPKSDVPLPKGAKVTSAISDTTSSKKQWLVTVEVSNAESAATAYKTQLTDAGYTVEDSFSASAGGGSIQAYTGHGTKWDVSVVGTKGTSSKKDSMLITVTTHDASSDTTTT